MQRIGTRSRNRSYGPRNKEVLLRRLGIAFTGLAALVAATACQPTNPPNHYTSSASKQIYQTPPPISASYIPNYAIRD